MNTHDGPWYVVETLQHIGDIPAGARIGQASSGALIIAHPDHPVRIVTEDGRVVSMLEADEAPFLITNWSKDS